MNIYNDQKAKKQDLQEKISNSQKKATFILDYESSKKEMSRFVDMLPHGTREFNNIVNEINDYAIARGLEISSFTPKGERSNELYDTMYAEIAITSDNYEALCLLVKDIESSPNNLRVESLSVSTTPSGRRRRYSRPIIQSGELNIKIEVASINFNK